MKNNLVKALALSGVALSMLSCGGKASSNGASGDVRMGLAIYKYDDTFMSGMRREFETFANEAKVKLTSADGQNSQAMQNDQIDSFIVQGEKAIIVNPVDRTASGTLIEKSKIANIPMVFINREPYPEDMAKWEKVYYVGARAADSGRMGAEIIHDYFKANPAADKNGDGKIQYVVLMGEPGHQDAMERTSAVESYFSSSEIKGEQVKKEYANWDRIKGQEVTSAFIAAYGENIEAVLANNDDMALGAIEALKGAGYFGEDKKFMPVVGVDASAPALDAMASGTLLGSSLNDAKNQSKAAFEIALAMANGVAPSTTVVKLTSQKGDAAGNYAWIPYQKVTQDNYKTFK